MWWGQGNESHPSLRQSLQLVFKNNVQQHAPNNGTTLESFICHPGVLWLRTVKISRLPIEK